jgi:hypothetical protein
VKVSMLDELALPADARLGRPECPAGRVCSLSTVGPQTDSDTPLSSASRSRHQILRARIRLEPGPGLDSRETAPGDIGGSCDERRADRADQC